MNLNVKNCGHCKNISNNYNYTHITSHYRQTPANVNYDQVVRLRYHLEPSLDLGIQRRCQRMGTKELKPYLIIYFYLNFQVIKLKLYFLGN